MNRTYILLGTAAVLLGGASLVLYLRTAAIPILEPAGPIALAERHVIIITVLLCSIVVIPVFVLLFLFAWKYRAGNAEAHVHHRPDWDHTSLAAELTWWLVPTAIIAALAVIAWQSSHRLDPYQPLGGSVAPITIDVVALDWKWLFIYPQEGIASVNMLTIPENVPIHFELTADAPMNSFWIPQLGGQIMVMPGMETELNLLANRVGTFNGFSANISGDGFSGMAFTVKSLSEGDFQNWVQSIEQSSSTPLTLSTYNSLAAPSEYNPIQYYSPVDPDLYTGVIMKFMMPESGMMNSAPMIMPMATSTP